jgi:hypothetical protein
MAGETAAKVGQKLLDKYEDSADEEVINWLDVCLRKWDSNKVHHHSARSSEKMNQARSTYAYGQQLEAIIKDFDKLLKDPEIELDESWRDD